MKSVIVEKNSLEFCSFKRGSAFFGCYFKTMLFAYWLHDVKCGKFSSTYRNGCHSAWILYMHSILNLKDKEVRRKSPLEKHSCVTRKEVDLHSLSWLLQLEFKCLQSLFHSYHLNTINVLLVPDQRIIQRRLLCKVLMSLVMWSDDQWLLVTGSYSFEFTVVLDLLKIN